MPGFLGATLDPNCISSVLLGHLKIVIVAGQDAGKTLAAFARAVDHRDSTFEDLHLDKGEAVIWHRDHPADTVRFRFAASETPRTRHSRKYAEAILTPDRSFYFRGSENKLNLWAWNLITFVQMIEGVDRDTFSYHLGRHDYSQWFRDSIKNPELAEVSEEIENGDLEIGDAKAAIKQAIEERYTFPG